MENYMPVLYAINHIQSNDPETGETRSTLPGVVDVFTEEDAKFLLGVGAARELTDDENSLYAASQNIQVEVDLEADFIEPEPTPAPAKRSKAAKSDDEELA